MTSYTHGSKPLTDNLPVIQVTDASGNSVGSLIINVFAVMPHANVKYLGASVTTYLIGPSLPPPAIEELKAINHYVPEGSEVFVPHAGVRYWFEALHYGEYVVLKRPPPIRSGAYVVAVLRGPRPPPVARLVYEGGFFAVFKLP